jgi:hypothetical protein
VGHIASNKNLWGSCGCGEKKCALLVIWVKNNLSFPVIILHVDHMASNKKLCLSYPVIKTYVVHVGVVKKNANY